MSEAVNPPPAGSEDGADIPARYARQVRFPGVGAEGQRKLLAARVVVCGCGALGSAAANVLARAGVGYLRVLDRDFLELDNLQRQMLYDEADLADGLPKAEAAARKLRAINSEITVEPHVADLDPGTIGTLCRDVDLIIDGTDNFGTRFLINDYACKASVPWVYGGAIGSEGRCLTVVPRQTPCLRCLMESAPPPGTIDTCETAGVLGPTTTIVAGFQVAEALRLLVDGPFAATGKMLLFDLWAGRLRWVDVAGVRRQDCPACGQGRYDWLDGSAGADGTTLCGRNSVQVSPAGRQPIDLARLAERLGDVHDLSRNRFLLRFRVGEHRFTVFPDGRAIIQGTDDLSQARTLFDRYIGS